MEEVRIVRRRSRLWIAIVIAIIVVALIVAFVLFNNRLPLGNTSWNGIVRYPVAVSLPLFV